MEDVNRAVRRWVDFADEAQVDPKERDGIALQMAERDRIFDS